MLILLVLENPFGLNDIMIFLGSCNKLPNFFTSEIVEFFMHSFYPIRVIKGFFYLEGLNTRDKRVMFTKVCQTFASSYPFCDASKDVAGGVLKHLKSQSRFLSLLFKFFFTRLNSSWRNPNLLFLCLWETTF